MIVRVLNVAEKNSVARELCNQLSGGRNQLSVRPARNGIYVADFPFSLNNAQAQMTVTAVRGHLKELDFPDEYRQWRSVDQDTLFTCPIKISIAHNDLATNLRQLSREADWLILWLDCDREGEAIAFEVLDVCMHANRNLRVFRAKFSALTRSDLLNALRTLGQPNRFLAEAVQARSEIDLRVGVAFTRYLTLRYQDRLSSGSGEKKLVSFGGCQTVTIGFVVARWLQRTKFVSESFWSLKLACVLPNAREPLNLLWNRNRVFCQQTVTAIHALISAEPLARVTQWTEQPKSKWRPLPMNTLEMTKLASTQLRIPSHQCMQLAESLYGKGLISYPRTETEIFHDSMDLRAIVREHANNSVWGEFVQRLVHGDLYAGPRRGSKDDQAHPPIHPLKSAEKSQFDNFDEYRVYELVCRHCFACVAKDAKGSASHVEVSLGFEKFHADGLTVLELNWLEIYPYTRWTSTTTLPALAVGDQLPVQRLEISSGQTEAPQAITEAELLVVMDKEGIGTDATMHEHIRTIQDRGYCYMDGHRFFIPTNLGIALVVGLGAYEPLGFHLAKPLLRASMERDMALIAQGTLSKQEVVGRYVDKMRDIFGAIRRRPGLLDTEIANALSGGGGNGFGGTDHQGGQGALPPTVRSAYMAPPGAPTGRRGQPKRANGRPRQTRPRTATTRRTTGEPGAPRQPRIRRPRS